MAGVVVLGGAAARAQAPADRWNDPRVQALVALATERRNRQVSDTGLTDYRAAAHGYLTFLAQVGPGFPDPPKIVRTDELAVEVYWRAPDLSKQRVVGQRDTLLLPADIGYYSDRYGIVVNDFPNAIRLGDARDVRDVPHPLAPGAAAWYDYRIADSLRITTGDRTVDVYGVRVRPRDPAAPRVVGTLYLDRATGALVRLAITFTRSAILDRRIETLTVTLDNALIEGRFWLPYHQELEVVRSGTWLDFPVRGIIRGRWQVCCYQLDVGVPLAVFAGPPIEREPPAILATHHWTGGVLDGLPADVPRATAADAQRVESTARAVVQARVLQRTRQTALSARGISDFARVDRVEGVALGAGASRALASDWTLTGRARFGISDAQAKGDLTVHWRPAPAWELRAAAFRSYRDVGDVAEGSLVANSIAALLAGADHTDLYDTRGAGVAIERDDWLGLRWSLTATEEWQRPLGVHASPVLGRFVPAPPALPLRGTRGELAAAREAGPGPLGLTWGAHATLRGEWFTSTGRAVPVRAGALARAELGVDADRPIGADRLVLSGSIGGATARGPLPPQEALYVGGPTSGPGYPYHAFVGRLASTLRAEWQLPVPFPSISLGRYGATPGVATLAPFLSADYLNDPLGRLPAGRGASRAGWYPAVGLGGLAFFDLLRIDVAHGLRAPGRWTVWVDVARGWWGIL